MNLYTCYGVKHLSRMTYWFLKEEGFCVTGSLGGSFICRWDEKEYDVFDSKAPFGHRFIKHKTFEEALSKFLDIEGRDGKETRRKKALERTEQERHQGNEGSVGLEARMAGQVLQGPAR